MAKDDHLLTDIRLAVRHAQLRPVYEVDTDRRSVPTVDVMLTDIGTIQGKQNLIQAIILRLLTPRGELSELGHPEYGSRLPELIGEKNSATTRNLMKLYMLESLQMEPRIEKVTELKIEPSPTHRESVTVLLRVKPLGLTEIVTIGPFTLEFK